MSDTTARAYSGGTERATPSLETGAGTPLRVRLWQELWRSLTRILSQLSRAEWLFVGLLLLCYAFFLTPENTNAISRYDMVYALSHGTAIIDQHANNTIDVSYFGGHWYSPRSLGLSLLAVPVLWVLGLFFNIDNTQVFTLTEQIAILNLLTVVPVAIVCALTLRRFVIHLRPSLAATPLPMVVAGAFALGTLAYPFATIFFSEAFGGALVFIGFYLLYRARTTGRPALRVLLAGLLVGFAVLSEYPAGLVMLALFGYIWLVFGGRRLRMLVTFGLGILPSGLLLGWYDWFAFGNPFALSYAYVSDSEFSGQHTGFFGVTWPHLDALARILVYPRGLLAESPFLLLVPLGFYYWFRAYQHALRASMATTQRDQQTQPAMNDARQSSAWAVRLAWIDRRLAHLSPEALLCLAVCILYPLAVASYFLPMAGENLPGPRLLIPMLPFACLTLAWVIDDRRRLVRTFFAVALCFGVLLSYIYVMAGVRMIAPYSPYPVTDLYWPLLSTGYVPRANGATPPNLATLWFMAPQGLSVYLMLVPVGAWLYYAVRAVLRGAPVTISATISTTDSGANGASIVGGASITGDADAGDADADVVSAADSSPTADAHPSPSSPSSPSSLDGASAHAPHDALVSTRQ